MYKRIVKSIVLGSLALLTALPALGQIRADLGGLHIRISNERPPRARHERRPSRTHRDAVWIGGYWDRQDERWDWVGGRWEQPTDRRHRWIRARYRQEYGSWRYEPAHWSHQRVIEGDDYRQWRDQQRSNRNRRR